jgi:hypothetical protein
LQKAAQFAVAILLFVRKKEKEKPPLSKAVRLRENFAV